MQRQHRNAFTLIELVIVLVILVGLAGIVVAMLPSMITRTHGAAGAANINEVAKWVQTYEAVNYSYPNRWDALIDTTGTLGGVSYLTALGAAADMNVADLTDAQATALDEAGITQIYHFTTTTTGPNFHATFNPYATLITAPTTVAEDVKVVTLTDVGKNKLSLDTEGEYVVLGLGGRSSMVGKGIVEAPVHFPDDPADDPASFYGRYGVVFKINVSRAFPVRVVAFHKDGLATGADHQAEFFDAVKNK